MSSGTPSADRNELDFAYTAPGIGRFRVNIYRQRGACGAAFRAIPTVIQPLAPWACRRRSRQFAHLPRGLVLVTGPTGSGKTTTLAALLDLANQQRAPHIVTIEDPIEFVHEHEHGLVNQREVGDDTERSPPRSSTRCGRTPTSSWSASCATWRPSPTALTAAETGHLVFATLHTQSAAQTIDRVIDIFPPHQQQEVRSQLSTTLQGVVTPGPRAAGRRHRSRGRRRDHGGDAGHPRTSSARARPIRSRRSCRPAAATGMLTVRPAPGANWSAAGVIA